MKWQPVVGNGPQRLALADAGEQKNQKKQSTWHDDSQFNAFGRHPVHSNNRFIYQQLKQNPNSITLYHEASYSYS
jgi:hypothetical protein